jgi:GDP-mannose 4,6-dehydratase
VTPFARVLVTGIAGSGGSYLAEHLVETEPGVEVHGLARWHGAARDHLAAVRDRVAVHEADLLDLGAVLRVLRAVRPDAIFHLASHANVRASFDTPVGVVQNNVLGTLNLLEAVRLAGIDPVIQLCSTSEVYGQVGPEAVPIGEDAPMRPASPYAASKAAQDLLGGTYHASWGLRIVRTRAFGYVNPRRPDLFASAFARQIARIEYGLAAELRHGNLDSVRTLVDVRDVMRAYWLAAVHGRAGAVYNVGGTEPVAVGEVLGRLVHLSRCRIPTRQDPRLLRPSDVTLQVPDVGRFRAATGWRPEIPLDESLRALLAHWRAEARSEVRDRPLPARTAFPEAAAEVRAHG